MRKSERLLNLLILLLVQRSPVTKQRIRATMPEYAALGHEAFERMFDRDKDELRAIGVPLEVVPVGGAFEEEPGYRIRADEFALPGIELPPDEAAVVGLASRVWQHAGLASATSNALAKLVAAGVLVDPARLDVATPAVAVADPHFDELWQASLDRCRIRFDHRRAGATEFTTRTVEPWGVVSSSGRWYVVGRDVDKDATRLFRLSRIRGTVRRLGRGGAYDVPSGTDLRALARSLAPPPATLSGTVLVRRGSALGLRRAATVVAEGVRGPDATRDWDRLEVTASSLDGLVSTVLQHGPSAMVETPSEARELAVTRLRALLEPDPGRQ